MEITFAKICLSLRVYLNYRLWFRLSLNLYHICLYISNYTLMTVYLFSDSNLCPGCFGGVLAWHRYTHKSVQKYIWNALFNACTKTKGWCASIYGRIIIVHWRTKTFLEAPMDWSIPDSCPFSDPKMKPTLFSAPNRVVFIQDKHKMTVL
jgi:hypothetical protein